MQAGGHVRVFLDEHLEQQMNLVDSASVASSVAIENKLAAVAPAAPGMKYTHYAPKAPLRLVQGDDSCMLALIHQARARGLRVGVLTTADSTLIPQLSTIDDILTIKCGHRSDLESVAAKLYDALREFDDAVPAVQLILSECFPAHNDDIGMAIMNRLAKAAAHRVLCSTDVESNTWLAQL
jgi:L-threonylcarbamoyladenylate synthase